MQAIKIRKKKKKTLSERLRVHCYRRLQPPPNCQSVLLQCVRLYFQVVTNGLEHRTPSHSTVIFSTIQCVPSQVTPPYSPFSCKQFGVTFVCQDGRCRNSNHHSFPDAHAVFLLDIASAVIDCLDMKGYLPQVDGVYLLRTRKLA